MIRLLTRSVAYDSCFFFWSASLSAANSAAFSAASVHRVTASSSPAWEAARIKSSVSASGREKVAVGAFRVRRGERELLKNAAA